MEQRIRFLARAEAKTERLGDLCAEFEIARSTGWRWLKRLEGCGRIEDLAEKSRRPGHSPNETAEADQKRVMALREQYGWGAMKLQVMLQQQGLDLTVSTINRILRRRGALERENPIRPARRRFERAEPNQLWQMDFKGMPESYAARHGLIYPLSILDDHSRFAVGLYGVKIPSGMAVRGKLIATFREYGMPEAMLMDHGSPWWSTSNGHGLTGVSVMLLKQGVKLYFSGIGHPQTQGKVERFHRTMQQYMNRCDERFPGWGRLLRDFREEYNQVRPHQAIGMEVPAARYRRSARMYQERPRKWTYAEREVVRKLNSKGCVKYRGERHFVCEALRGEEVCLEELSGRVLVRYRQTYIREIDPNTGQTRALVLAARA